MRGAAAFSMRSLLLALLAVSACRDFSPSRPFPCSTNGRCPDGFTCDEGSRLCYLNGQHPDADSRAGDADSRADSPTTQDGSAPDGADVPDVGADATDAPTNVEARPDMVPVDAGSDLGPEASKVPNGGACTVGSECESSVCVENLCCENACREACFSCKGADTGKSDGVCAFVSAGKDPHDHCTETPSTKCGNTGSCDGQGACQKYGSNQVCSPAACAGSVFTSAGTCNGAGACTPGTVTDCKEYQCSATGCAKACATDEECLGQSYCGNGTCAAKKTSGQACTDKRECASGFCVDGFCCEGGCAGVCESCAAAANGQADGRCLPVQAGKLSPNECTMSGGTCGQDGTCDGNRKCRVAAANLGCGSASCSNSSLTPAPTCDGAGACRPGQAQACPGALVCGSATICKTSCGVDGDCVGQTYCNGGTCVAKKDAGGNCTDKRECSTGFCADSVCCESACSGTCQACSTNLTGMASGKCAAVKPGLAHGGDCTADGTTCGTDGKCDGAGACRFTASGTACKGESCLVGTSTHSPGSTCNGKGSCLSLATEDCDRYMCSSDGVRCRGSCASDGECTTKAYCDTGPGLCALDLQPGQVCKRSEQCTTNSCGGRCCPTASRCTCPQPSPGNLLKNAGLDTAISGWESEGTVNTWSSDDSDGCPFSGSMRPSGYPLQCATVIDGTSYNFGVTFRAVEETDLVITCWLTFFQGFTCSETRLGDATEIQRFVGALDDHAGQRHRPCSRT